MGLVGQSTHRRKKSKSMRFHQKVFKYFVAKRKEKSGLFLVTSGLSPHRKTTFAKCGLSNTYESVCGGGEGGIPIGY